MRRLTPFQIALIAGGLLVLAFVAWTALGTRGGNPDRLSDAAATRVQAKLPDLVQRCGAQSTYDLIKAELFRRAGAYHAADRAQFDLIASKAVLRMERPVLESDDNGAGAIACSGSLTLDLPPGIVTSDGRSSLAADIGYTLQRSADGNGDVVTLSGADNLVVQLAGLTKAAPAVAPPPAGRVDPLAPAAAGPQPPVAPPAPVAPQARPTPPPPPPAATARASFNCASARSRGEVAVCADPGLAALDRQMASQFFAAMRSADPETRAALQRSGERFIAYRDQCPSTQCIVETYRGRMREIRDIASGALR